VLTSTVKSDFDSAASFCFGTGSFHLLFLRFACSSRKIGASRFDDPVKLDDAWMAGTLGLERGATRNRFIEISSEQKCAALSTERRIAWF